MMRLQLRETTANTSGLSLDSTYKRAFELTALVTTECPPLSNPVLWVTEMIQSLVWRGNWGRPSQDSGGFRRRSMIGRPP